MKEFNEKTVLETDRLYLRYLRPEDREAIFRNINHDKDVLADFIDRYVEDIKDFSLDRRISSCLEKKKYFFAVCLKDSNEVIGEIFQINSPDPVMNNVEIGYALGKKYWNKGYMSEALAAMIDFMFSLGVHKVYACHLEGNEASGRVMRKCGMTYQGKAMEDIY